MNQKGIANIALMILLVVGLIAGVYLVQQTQIFKPKAAEPQSVQTTCTGFENSCDSCINGNQICRGKDENGEVCIISQVCNVPNNDNSCDCSGDKGTGVNYNQVSCDVAGAQCSNEVCCIGSFNALDGRADSCHYCITPFNYPTPTPTSNLIPPYYNQKPPDYTYYYNNFCDKPEFGNCSWTTQCSGEKSVCIDAKIGDVTNPLWHECCKPLSPNR